MPNNSHTELYPWLQRYWAKLAQYRQQDRLPNAIMLVGDQGLGLPSLASCFAKSVFCLNSNENNGSCGACSSCLLFEAGNYPDYFYLQPEEDKTSISIDAIRKLIESLALNNQYVKQRIVIIDSADVLLHNAANSLLKTLEEPSENTSLILITHKLSKVSATIRSRCQLITVKDIEQQKAIQWLQQSGCKEARQYLNLANHAPLLAFELWEKNALAVRDALFKEFLNLIEGRLDPLQFASQCIALKEMPFIKWIMSWLTDAIKSSHSSKNIDVMNPDLLNHLKVIAEKLHLKDIHGLLDKLNVLFQLESRQVNQQLMLEEFAIHCYSLSTNKRL